MNYAGRAILMGLDEMFDTRLGTLVHHFPESFDEIMDAGYYDRLRDAFPMVDYASFRKLYDQRDDQVLLKSLTTPALDMAMELIFKLHDEIINEPFRKLPTLVVNTWPYDLSQEARDGLRLELHAMVGVEVPLLVDFVHLAPKDLYLDVVARTFDAVFLYDYFEWLDLHAEHLEHARMAHVKLIGPGLFKDQEVVERVMIDEVTQLEISPLTAVQLILNRYLEAEIIPVRIFSAISPENNLTTIAQQIEHRELEPAQAPVHALDPSTVKELSPFEPLTQTDFLPPSIVQHKSRDPGPDSQ